jgi:transcriptional regulator with XRE-family HTH domain
MKGSLNKKLENPKFREKFDHGYEFFKLEVQILNAMEDKGWTYEDLAKAVGTSRQNIWRDLKNGGLHKASLERVARIAEAVGLHMHPILMTPQQEKALLPTLQRLATA